MGKLTKYGRQLAGVIHLGASDQKVAKSGTSSGRTPGLAGRGKWHQTVISSTIRVVPFSELLFTLIDTLVPLQD